MKGHRIDNTGKAYNMRRTGLIRFRTPSESLDERARAIMWKYHVYFYTMKKTGCWRWPLGLNSSGYGVWWWEGRVIGARRWVYQQASQRELPRYLFVNRVSKCAHTDCVRPSHMKVGRRHKKFTKKAISLAA